MAIGKLNRVQLPRRALKRRAVVARPEITHATSDVKVCTRRALIRDRVEEREKEERGMGEGSGGGRRRMGRVRAVCGDNEQNVDSTTLVKPDI